MSQEYILSQGYGYGFAVGVGALFALLMTSITYLLDKYANDHQDSENFTTASRSVKKGLLSSAVVSSWTWPATLLTSGGWSYTYGIQGSFWYGVTGTMMVLIMAVLAVEIKRICPGTHTVGEIVRARFGTGGHSVYMVYLAGCNIIVSVMLLLGGSQGFNASTGMNVAAACFLLPLGVICYTVLGGIKATFLSDWIHTIIIYVIIITIVFQTYATNDLIGSPGKMYDLLVEMGNLYPSSSDDGSYLSFQNGDFIMVVWSVLLGSFATVLGDPSYGQKAIAASPRAAMTGYFLGGLCWFIVPWALGTSAGLAALALTKNPAFFTYPNPISADGVGRGLPVIYGFGALLGTSGAAAALCMLFMSVTSALSAELIGISSILTYDVYRSYINPRASGKSLVNVSHCVIAFWGIAMGAVCIGFDNAGVTVGWILSMLGIILAPVGTGLVMCLYHPSLSKWAIIIGYPLGTAGGIATWIGTTHHFTGEITKDSLAAAQPCLIANFTSAFLPVFFGLIVSWIWPQPCDLKNLNREFKAGDDANETEIAAMTANKDELKSLKISSWIGMGLCFAFFVILFFIVPFSFYGQKYIFSKKFFTGWISVMIMWLLLAFSYIAIYPIYESWEQILYVTKRALGKSSSLPGSEIEVLDSGSERQTDLSLENREKVPIMES